MNDLELLRNTFALGGIIIFSKHIVIMSSDIIYNIRMRGIKNGISRWLNHG